MASDSEDSEGEELGMIRPGLIRELRNVLDEYPDDGQILKEMIQNAEDAGARIVKVLTDRRCFNRDIDTKTRRKHPHLRFFQGPSLCVYNDAEFTDADWKGIRMLHTSIKEKDPLKVGRFGLGFKSVFHLTDRIVIISGDYIMYMDPFKGEDRYCTMKRIEKLKGKELESALHCVQDVFGVRRETLGVSGGHFAGTLFWFPLRQAAGELSSTVYTQDKLQDLVNAFKAESHSMLLFLKNLERVELFWRDGEGTLQELFAVGLADSCVDSVRHERQRFMSTLRQADKGLPDTGVDCVAQVTMETVDHQVTMDQQNVCARQTSSRGIQRWLVVHYHPGIEEMSQELVELCRDPELSYRPHVGVAIPLKDDNVAQTNPLEAETADDHHSFQSQIFCFLPLPLHTRSPTGLPVHVNGYLALSQNRRHLKWPTQDQLANNAHLEPAVRWNCLVVRELLPTVYARLLGRLREVYHATPSDFFSAWPDLEKVDDMWRPLAEPLYRALAGDSSFYTQALGGQWVRLTQCVLPAFSDDFSAEEAGAVLKVFRSTNQNLVLLPTHVKKAMRDFGLLHGVPTITPLLVSRLLPGCVHNLARQEKLSVLHYLCTSDNVSGLLEDKPLLPLSNGQFGMFWRRQTEASLTYFCEQELASLFPGLDDRFCDVTVPQHIWRHLKGIAETGELSVRVLLPDDKQVPNLLASSVHVRCPTGVLSLPSDDPWLPQVWQFLSSTAPWRSDLGPLVCLPLLPCQTGKMLTLCPLRGLYVCSGASGLPQLTSDLTQSLGKLRLTVLPRLPDYVTRHGAVLGQLVRYPHPDEVMELLGAVGADTALCQEAVQRFNDAASTAEREAILKLISEVTTVDSQALHLLQQLKLFTNISGDYASVQETQDIFPDCGLPLHPPRPFLRSAGSTRSAAAKLGARQLTLQEIVAEILQLLVSGKHFTSAEAETFMAFFLERKTLSGDPSLLAAARQVRFVRTGKGQVKKAEDLYDRRCPILAELFLDEDRFPHGDFVTDSMLTSLRRLGLRSSNDVAPSDLLTAADQIQNLYEATEAQQDTPVEKYRLAERKASGLMTFLCKHGTEVPSEVMKQLSQKRCLPCLQPDDRPGDYPKSLPLQSQPAIVRPADLCSYSLAKLTGSVLPVLASDMPDAVMHLLSIRKEPTLKHILDHLHNVCDYYQISEMSQYRIVFAEIFTYLTTKSSDKGTVESLKQCKCVLVESGDRFVHPHKFWVQRNESDIDLRPYRFPLPLDLMHMQELFLRCGCSERQDVHLLQRTLEEIRDCHECKSHCQNVQKDLLLVKQILTVLKTKTLTEPDTTLLPIEHAGASVLKFKPAHLCTVGSVPWQSDHLSEDGEEIFYVHHDIDSNTATALGALKIKDRALTEVEDFDFDYGQREELTTRLHNLLEESYTDGFSVPKELIQNADDAGATEVCFLLDERENSDARCNLITDKMALLQGPAIWAYNNAIFTDEDFENITKLGAATKKEDASKVGRFGLGFNAVYNLTDTPSFISRHILAIFDPQEEYLEKGGGLKLDFSRKKNLSLLLRMPKQFQPFQNVFGCTLQAGTEVNYKGTLFRFPLRTREQAASSKLKGESYSQEKCHEFLRLLLCRAGSLLMFTQSVQKIQVFHLSKESSDPSMAKCLLTVTRTSSRQLIQPPDNSAINSTILQYCTAQWPRVKDIKILEDVSIEMEVLDEAKAVCGVQASHMTTDWKLAWATGTGTSAEAAGQLRQEGLVPLATVAVQLKNDGIVAPSENPAGFYTSGHLFCFLPLPEEMVRLSLQVHINGTFALTSSRRGLLVRTEDDIKNSGHDWNSALFGDAVCRAYLTVLEKMKVHVQTVSSCERYFSLWPDSGDFSLDGNFYRRLVSDGNRVFPVPGQDEWVAFQDCWFLDPVLSESDCGQIAWDAARCFWIREGRLVDVPAHVCRLMERKGQAGAFQSRMITLKDFFKSFLFPNIESSEWLATNRNKLVLLALKQSDPDIRNLLSRHACIPCLGSGELKRPCDLIHPGGAAAKLYLPDDNCFPQKAATSQSREEPNENFRSHEVLCCLEKLGMIRDDLPWQMLVERVNSVSKQVVKDQDLALKRTLLLVEYLSSVKNNLFRIQHYPPDIIDTLSKSSFLPVLGKPDDWPFPWFTPKHQLLAAPRELFSDRMKELVGCHAKLLDTALMKRVSSASGTVNFVLECLGVRMKDKTGNEELTELAIDQLLTISQHSRENSSVTKASSQTVCLVVYKFLSRSLKSEDGNDTRQYIVKRLSGTETVWTGTEFVLPTRAAFSCSFDCRPYLFLIDTTSSLLHRPLLQLMGVKETFETNDVLWVLDQVYTEYKDKQLSQEEIGLVARTAQLLCQTVKTSKAESLKSMDVFLPDRKGYMMPTCQLCLDDCEWLKETETMKFVHDAIPPETAKSLGVETKRGMDFDQLMLPMEFGQSEKLTNRIKRLLQGYTFDSSFFKELIQNADDAGATEIRFILDSRSLGKSRVPENWSHDLQGPALCVYNNKSFTTKDIEGIQNLGEGSKGEDLVKTGKYGVGFNAVYHITDVPSFWTRENDENEVICIFDPNCRYVRNTSSGRPGVKLGNVDRIRKAYPDMFAGYLETSVDMSLPGAMFRFPLRTEAMSKMSDIKNTPVTYDDMKKHQNDFQSEMKNCLLFLNNLQKIGIYSTLADGTVKSEYVVETHVEKASSHELTRFRTHLQTVTKGVTDRSLQLHQISELESVVHMTFKDSEGKKENWLTVNRIGFRSGACFSEQLLHEWQQEHFRLLPRGGVAVRLAPDTTAHDHFAFCILPLPLPTKLPMHVNGHFALDHETRRDLWKHVGDARTEWNTLTALRLIVPAYITAIQCLRKELFETEETLSNQNMYARLHYYQSMFPDPLVCLSDCWKRLVNELYRQIAEQELCIFPVSQNNWNTLEWVPAYKKDGFHGYFFDPVKFFKNKNETCLDRLVVLSQGRVSQTSSHLPSNDSYRQSAKRLQTLLKDLNMKVVECPFHIYVHFINSGVNGVQQVTPSTVIEFLKSASSGRSDGCNLSALPQPVTDTSLRTPADVRFLIDFVKLDDSFFQQLAELPLSLRQSGNLYYFLQDQVSERPIVSRFLGLLKGSADLFLHEDIFTCFQHVPQDLNRFLRELDIPTFAELLPQSLPESHYKTGQSCPMQTDMHTWVSEFWDFVQNQLKHLKGENETRQRIENMLQCLNDWNLLPVRNANDGAGYVSLLCPLKHRHRVVYLTKTIDQSHSNMWKILQKLPLTFLQDSCLPCGSVATNIVASLRHPVALLHALTLCRQGLNTAAPYASDILSYFNNNLPVLRQSCADWQLQEMLKKLPFYTTIDGKISDISSTVLTVCLARTFPRGGLAEWSQRRSPPLHLLRAEEIPVDLQHFLRCTVPAPFQFYKWLLSSLEYLPDDDVLTHITHLKISLTHATAAEEKSVIHLLKTAQFIVVNGQRHKGSDFYRMQEPVFKTMLPAHCFPPRPYCVREWESFMRLAGMVCDVTDEMFIDFARQLEAEGQARLTPTVINKSEVLVGHLFQTRKFQLLEQVRNISFVRPSDWPVSSKDGQSLSSVVEPYPADRLVSFAESCQERHLHLVWTTSCILHESANPARYPQFLSHVSFLEAPPAKKVLDHIKNLCFALKGNSVDRNGFMLLNRSLLLKVFENIYEHLNTFTDAHLNELRQLPVICDINSKLMLIPDTVVIDLREDEAIKGYIHKSPEIFGKFNSLFEQLGVSRRVTATHYARVLSTLKSETGDEALHVEEMKAAIQAVAGLFRCLKKSSEADRCLQISHIYLPSEREKLLESSKLVFIDNGYLYRRLQRIPEPLPFFIGFGKLEIDVPLPEKEVKLLPDGHQMMWLSHLVKEVVTEDSKEEAAEGVCSRHLQEMFANPTFVYAVTRMVYAEHCRKNRAAHQANFTQEDADQVRESLSRICVREVTVLQTILQWKEDPVPGTEKIRISYVDKQNKNSVRSCTVYVSRDNVGASYVMNETLLRSLRAAVEFVLDIRFTRYIESILRNVDDAVRIMDEEGVPQCDYRNQQDKERDSVIPLPGNFVPVAHHCYLDNNFYIFGKGEHVGFEVYDPSLEPDEITEDEAVYIYAVVIGEVEQDGHVPLLARRYLVDLGPERGTAEVSVTKLYKFIRKARKGTSTAMVPFEGDGGTDSGKILKLDMREVLKGIRTILNEAWRLPDEKDRMRVVKRLLLKWHPDKNKGNDQFCTRVFQKLQHYVELLKEGKRLPEDEDDVDGSFHRSSRRSSSSPFHSGGFSSFFESMFRRGRSYHQQYESDFSPGPSTSSGGYSSGYRGGAASGASTPNPQPGEGRRWFRQAEADVAAAQSARKSCLESHNWVCYQCHQAVEKALKAVLYYRDARRYLLHSHELGSLAQSVHDDELCRLTCSIESRVGNHMRMRYPDVLQFPRIPTDVYTADDSDFALDVAMRVIIRAKSLV